MEENKERALEILKKFEPYRLECLKKKDFKFFFYFFSPLIITIPCWIIGHYLINVIHVQNPFATACYIFGGFTILFIFIPAFFYQYFDTWYKNNFKRKVKNVFFPSILPDCNEEIEYLRKNRNKVITKSQIEKSKLFYFFDKSYIDDALLGTYEKMPFIITDSRLYIGIGYGINKSGKDVFKGTLLLLKLNQKRSTTIISDDILNSVDTMAGEAILKIRFVATLIILFCASYIFTAIKQETSGQGIMAIFISLLIIISFIIFSLNKYKKLNNRRPKTVFEENGFKIYSDNTEEAEQITTPEFLIELLEFKKKLKGENIRCSFYENNLMVAIDTKRDLFEIGNLNEPLGDPNLIDDFYAELNTIYDFMDYIKNNEDLN